MVEPLWKTTQQFLIRLQTQLLVAPQFQSWVLIQEMKLCPHKDLHRNAPCKTIHSVNTEPRWSTCWRWALDSSASLKWRKGQLTDTYEWKTRINMYHNKHVLELLFSHSVISDSLWPHGLQHARLLCPSLSPGACSNSRPLSSWRYLTILSSVNPFSFFIQSFPASGSFPMSCLFVSHGQRIGASASAVALPMNIQGWFPLGSTGLISLLSKGLKSLLQHYP